MKSLAKVQDITLGLSKGGGMTYGTMKDWSSTELSFESDHSPILEEVLKKVMKYLCQEARVS